MSESLGDVLARYQQTFERDNNYGGFIKALMLCGENGLPLPKWVYKVVIRLARKEFEHGSTGPGKHGNWRAKLKADDIHMIRAGMAHVHLRARRREGRDFVSDLATAFVYGTPRPGGGANITTREDVFEFVSKQLRGTPAQGDAGAVEESYNRVKRTGAFKKDRRPDKLLIKGNRLRAAAERAEQGRK